MSSQCFCDISYRFRSIQILNFWPPKSNSRSNSAIYAITPFDGKYQNLQMSPTNFCASYYHFRYIYIYKFFIFDLQVVGQGHRVQFMQLQNSMANVKIYKYLSHIFVLALTIEEKYKFYIFYIQNVGQCPRV